MPRLFTALELPEAIRLHLSLIRAPITGAKWVEAENMHITLRFAGDIDERTADDFASRLRDIKAEPLAITIAGSALCWPRGARALWAGVEGGAALEHLHRANERAARAAGLERDPHAFKPHVTLARPAGCGLVSPRVFLRKTAACGCCPSWHRVSSSCRRGRAPAARPTPLRKPIRSLSPRA